MSIESKVKETSPTATQEGGSNAPSGFILKLFQMVNGAPDEVISWTPAGDAFIIGSDLNRLESETLPQYFRHNRFQSLVRQLNFYSFRKINRERNVWVYKHKLFHRDHPEDLYQVRRRTCPGVDGRKQRFSRYSTQRLSKYEDGSDDDSSLDSNSGDESEAVTKKRRGSMSSVASSNSKRSRRLWQGEENPVVEELPVSPTLRTTVLEAPKSLSAEVDDDDSSASKKKSDRMEMIERSLIVSEVASKLEEYAKKALKGRGSGRTRRTGVVTPPYGYSKTAVFSSRDLITYDDEYEKEAEDLSGLVTDGEDSMACEDDFIARRKDDSGYLETAPVANSEKILHIVAEIRNRARLDMFNGTMINACADVADFLMKTAPAEDPTSCCTKVLALLSSSDRLASDFHSYRSALHFNGEQMLYRNQSHAGNHTVALRRALESGSSKGDALREFKIFAANLIYKLLGKNGSFGITTPFSAWESKNLLRTADAWSKSVGHVA